MRVYSYRTTMPFTDGLSPPTDRSIMPANNVPTIQDVLNGTPYQLPGGGGDWSSGRGEDTEKSYKEKGDEYKRTERDWDILQRMLMPSVEKREMWKVKMPGGAKYFGSLPSATRFEQMLKDHGVKQVSLSRVAASNEQEQVSIVAEAMPKCFKVESIDIMEGVKEVGSAFCVRDNYFLTCAHVIRNYDKLEKTDLDVESFAKDIIVKLVQNGQWHDAKVVAVDGAKDIALLQSDIKCPSFLFDFEELHVGEGIMTIGSPHGYENNVSTGILGSLNRRVYEYENAPNFMFVDLSIFSGNSGGPIIRESNGKVIGMIVLVVSDDGGYGLNAGLPSNYLEEFCNLYIK